MPCSAITITKPKTQPDQPKIEQRIVSAHADPILLSMWSHRAWVISGLVGYMVADLWSGVYHWVIDNYGNTSTPLFGDQIEEFQGHHMWPWVITKRQFANNLHDLGRAVTFAVLPIDLFCDNPIIHGFASVCFGCILFSQQFHAWAHSTKSRLPPLVVALEDLGILLPRSQHAAHHRPPYDNNYCIVSGI
ncbi:B domain of TMEM189, localization domain containing protein [Parasponia andersonii]|uniref:B domain of TMEM189, localization domain containing protein n=1 Tax=Parasponia andersonii TaxID=3476 RepID=A0A2P5BRW0_PARAD|nr:B domain of TMEM189, localization domain containing protein [Parasponia andersonii]